MSSAPWDIYAEQLVHLGYGHPLWVPDPAPGKPPVEVGDVGWMNEGEFLPLFNAFREEHDAQPLGAVPVDFVPLNVHDCTIIGPRDKISQTVLCSRSIRRVDLSGDMTMSIASPNVSGGINFNFECMDEAGALLVMSAPGRTTDILSRRRIINYMTAHFDSWLEFANHHLGLELREDQIIFVSGTMKTNRWGVAAFRGTRSEKRGSIVGNFGPLVTADFSFSMSDTQLSHSHYRFGPTDRQGPVGSAVACNQYDQCVFIHYYKRKRKWSILPIIVKAAAGPHKPTPGQSDDKPGGGDDPIAMKYDSVDILEGSDEFQRYPEEPPRVKDLADHVLDYILENSTASIAIASDTDYLVHCSDESRDESSSIHERYSSALKPSIVVDGQGLGVLAAGQSLVKEGVIPRPLGARPIEGTTIARDKSSDKHDQSHNPSFSPDVSTLQVPPTGQTASPAHVDYGVVPQVNPRTSALDVLYSDDGGYLQDTSQFSLDQFVQQRDLEAGGNTGCDRNKPRARPSPVKRVGACARCRRLKMKCTFTNPTDDICSRCTAGNYECHFPGRKPRSPGMRVVLQQQIREKNAMIDKVLSQVNPGPTMPTPLTLVPARLPLSDEERNKYRDVLAYLERSTTQAAARIGGDGRPKFDISALEDPSEVDSESEDEMEGVTSPGRAVSPKSDSRPMDTVLEVAAPTGIMALAALETRNITSKGTVTESSASDNSHGSVHDGGISNESYWLPGPATNLELRRLIVERQAAPDILLSGLVTPEDSYALFQIHYQWINPIIPILDENIHTPATVLARCPFLFTVICTVASRYYDEKPHIHGMAIHFAKAAAANAIIDGWKTVEMCQAFALWSVYNPPARRWEEDRAWCYTGIAFRLGSELSLSRIPEGQPSDERKERENHNRTRMWLMCYIMDRCLSIQSGKAWMVQEDVTIRGACQWLQRYKYHNACDGYLVSLTELLCIMSRFVGTVNPAFGTGSVESIGDIDFSALYKAYDDELLAWKSVIDDRHKGEKTSKEPAVRMQITLINCVYNYCRLVICCVGMQLMSKRPSTKKSGEVFAGCVQAATTLVKLMVEDFVPTGFVRYFPELIYVHAAFAAVVLMKCLRPEYNAYLDIQDEERIIELVKKLVEAWASDKINLDEKHNTQLYARFLKQLMDPHITRLAERKARAAAQQQSSMHPSVNTNVHMSDHTAASMATTEDQPHQHQQRQHQQQPQQQQPITPITPDSASSMFGGPDAAALGLGSLYATDLDVSKAAADLAAAGMVPAGGWEQFFPSTDGASQSDGSTGGIGAMAGMAGLGGMAGMSMSGAGPDGITEIGGTWPGGLSSDECLAAMMGLGNETWFF